MAASEPLIQQEEGRPYIEADEAAPVLSLFLAGTAPKVEVKGASGGTKTPATPAKVKVKTSTEICGGVGANKGRVKDKADPHTQLPPSLLTGDGVRTTSGGPWGDQRYYITTAINYTNGNPHMGHAYEAITSDVVARYHRMAGRQVFFLTGTDEHGQKIANTAQAQGIEPIDICDKYAAAFQALNRLLCISNNFYIRTTQEHHHQSARRLWEVCRAAGDIYLSKYEGWYNEREETFVTENDAKLSTYLDPVSLVPLKKVEEPSYFFRMSKYKERLVKHINDHPDFIRPEVRRKEILARLEEPLLDLSVSRTTFDWGIPVPEDSDSATSSRHVMYVWFDALSNYLSGVHGLDQPTHELSSFWPAQVHVIGKDIVWFHCVIWPTILMSAGLPLPQGVFAHGFINGPDGRKMSKSLGNVIDPHDMISKYPVDSFRFYLARETTFGGDLNFSEANLLAVHNNELADVLGNLVHRAVNLCHKYCGGVVPEVSSSWAPLTLPFDLAKLVTETDERLAVLALHEGAEKAMSAVRSTNKFLTDAEPWKLKGDENDALRQKIVRLTLEAVYAAAHFLAPYMPVSATLIFDKLGTSEKPIPALNTDFFNLKPGAVVKIGDILFAKIEEESNGAAGVAADGSKNQPAKGGDQKGVRQQKQQSAAPADPWEAADIRVGQIVKVWEHPEAPRLFCEEVDVGEEKPRQIASGLREHYSLEQMQDRKVLVVCNLKPARLAGFESQGMVLAGTAAEGTGPVVLVQVPEGAQVGDRVVTAAAGQHKGEPAKELKRRVWEQLAGELKTTADGTATYKGLTIETSAGPCCVPSVLGGVIR